MSFELHAQKTLYVSPVIGIQNPYCALSKENLNSPTFKANYLDIGLTYGIMFKLKLNERWSISTGLSAGDIGWGFRVTTRPNNPFIPPSDTTITKIQQSSSTAKSIDRFPLLLSYNLKNIEWVPLPKKNDSEQLYLFAFDIETILGVSYNRIPLLEAFDSSSDSSGVYLSGGGIPYNKSYELQRVWGVSVIAGLGFQFYRLGKPKFHLLLYYSQGLVDVINATVEYNINGENFTSKLYARGTIAGIQLSYPFRLKTFKKKEPR